MHTLGNFRFKKINSDYLLTNDVGEYAFIPPQDFNNLASGCLNDISLKETAILEEKGFINLSAASLRLENKYRSKNSFLGMGTSLHIIVSTLRCDHKCVYCHASAQGSEGKATDMDRQTAKAVVDCIFESPSKAITIEFQGGEPLLNFEILKFVTEYANDKNKAAGKDLLIAVVTNLSPLNDEILKFLIKNKISICTSIDGPHNLHNKNRFSFCGDSHAKVVKSFKRLQKAYLNRIKYRPNALVTITRESLRYPKEIIKEYIKLNLDSIHLRPLNPFGFAIKQQKTIGYTADEFLSFYRKSLDYILKINSKGKVFYERTARIFLSKIFNDDDPGYFELRSPCGAGIGQMAYNYNGDVYTCDEGRMVGRLGDDAFRLGNVREDNYNALIGKEALKAVCTSSLLDILPGCSNCVYKPYCGVCPIYNYVTSGTLFAQAPNNDRCKINTGILDYLFDKLRVDKNKKIFKAWLLAHHGSKTV
ncbi:MAG: His-Xaa-Ser system radical SAM maturase HxsB [Candidatus Omnitrophica bacterium]|nr:His-Xaa-Ser system radical SAM maturase HxsB [Candidatus Omnitrophota bacterium]